MTHHYLDLGSASDWLKQILSRSEALPGSGQRLVISMEFPRSLLRRHYPLFKENSGGIGQSQANVKLTSQQSWSQSFSFTTSTF